MLPEGKIEKIWIDRANLDSQMESHTCDVCYLVRYTDGSSTVVAVSVRLPVKDYSLNEFRQAAIDAAKAALSLMHRDAYELGPEQ